MARPIKKGLDYFPFDVTFFDGDDIELIAAEFGTAGQVAAMRLTTRIYRGEGYFYGWCERARMLLCKRVGGGFTDKACQSAVEKLCEYSYFDAGIFRKHSVLTSAEIQKRYIKACEKRRRITLVEDYMLINYKDYISSSLKVIVTAPDGDILKECLPNKKVCGPQSTLVSGINSQSKENKRKENESTANKNGAVISAAAGRLPEAVLKKLEAAGIAAAPSAVKMLEGFIKGGMADECLCYAIEEAAGKALNKPAYLKSILERMFEDGVKTKDALDEENKRKTPPTNDSREKDLPPDDYFSLHNSWDEI